MGAVGSAWWNTCHSYHQENRLWASPTCSQSSLHWILKSSWDRDQCLLNHSPQSQRYRYTSQCQGLESNEGAGRSSSQTNWVVKAAYQCRSRWNRDHIAKALRVIIHLSRCDLLELLQARFSLIVIPFDSHCNCLADTLEWICRQKGIHHINHYLDDCLIAAHPPLPHYSPACLHHGRCCSSVQSGKRWKALLISSRCGNLGVGCRVGSLVLCVCIRWEVCMLIERRRPFPKTVEGGMGTTPPHSLTEQTWCPAVVAKALTTLI